MPRWVFFCCFVAAACAVSCMVLPTTAYGQNSAGPQPVSLPAPARPPVDEPYVGTISLSVDLTTSMTACSTSSRPSL
jgi:hypothetical protein